MKKIFAFLLCCFMLVSVTGCGIKTDEQIEKELREKESACRAKGMYPSRTNCDDLSDIYCHVTCWKEPQKTVSAK